MKPRRAAWLLAALLPAAAWAGSTEVQDTIASAYKAFLEGRLDDAVSSFKYLTTLGVAVPQADGNLALLARDKGNQDEALAGWVRSTLEDGADGFIWDQRGWAYLSADRPKEAREAFLKAIDRAKSTASQAEANLGLGMAALSEAHPKEAMVPLRTALVQGPYILSAASFETALTALASGDKQAALAYLRQSADVDPRNLEALRALAGLCEKIGENRQSWEAFHDLAAFDPQDEEVADKLKKIARYITGDPATSLPIRRLSRPLLDPDAKGMVEPSNSSDTIRVALFSLRDGTPATLTNIYAVANSDFKLVANTGEIVRDDGHGFEQWQIQFRSENNLVEVRDASGNIQYSSKQPFMLVPKPRQGSVLLKSGTFIETTGFDPGDRELRGSVEIVPTPYGFKVVNQAIIEDYLYGVVGAALPEYSPDESYKAEAVVARTFAYWSKAKAKPNLEHTDTCDADTCQRYIGLNAEMRGSTKGVAETEGLVLTYDYKLAKVMQHENSGGITEDGSTTGDPDLAHLVSVVDAPTKADLPRTPLQLERWLHGFPQSDSFAEAGNMPERSSRWIRILDADLLKRRIERVKVIGWITHIRALRRSATGRVQSLQVIGTRGTVELDGEQAISDFLSPGSLRSMLFTITPLMHGSNASRFILWGAGTGSGLGFCRAGAVGQGGLGRDFKTILATYFPKYVVDDVHAKGPPPAGAAVNLPIWKKMPKNPRRGPHSHKKKKKKPAAAAAPTK